MTWQTCQNINHARIEYGIIITEQVNKETTQ